jgi:hypothetical protein
MREIEELPLFATKGAKEAGGPQRLGDPVIGKTQNLTTESRRHGEEPKPESKNRHH